MVLGNFFLMFPPKLRQMYEQETSGFNRQRYMLLFLFYIPVTFFAVIAEAVGLTGPTDTFFNYTHAEYIILSTIWLLLFFNKKINISTCLALFTAIGQLTISVEMIYVAFTPTEYNKMLIVANTVLLAMNAMVSMTVYLRWNTMILGVITIATYVICMLITDDAAMRSFLILFLITFSMISIFGLWVAKISYKMEQEYTQLKKNNADLLHILRLKKDEVMTYISLASEKHSHDGLRVMMDRLDKKSMHNLLTNVELYLKNRDTDLKIIEKCFPELTPSERDICRLILQGKKLGEICTMLDKSESNINSQRANMRRKLGLQSSDNLMERLQLRLNEYRGDSSSS